MLKNKPACCFAALAIGISLVPVLGSILPTILISLLILTALFLKKRFFVVVLCFALVGTVVMMINQPNHVENNIENVSITGYVADEVKTDSYNIKDVKIEYFGNSFKLNKMVRLKTETRLTGGDKIKLTGTLKPYLGSTNFGGINMKTIMLSNGTSHSVFSKEVEIIGTKSNPTTFFGGMKQQITKSIDGMLGEEHSALVKAILLGEKSGISEETLSDFRTSGISHILAISGLHIGIIVAALCFVLRKLKPTTQIFYVSIFLLCFLFLTCFNPSVFRASIMAIIWLISKAKGYRYNLLTSLFTAGIVLLLFNPYNLYSAGFLLSFTCVLGIGLFYNWFYSRLTIFIKPIRTSLAMYFACQLAMLPVAIYFFNQFQLYSFLANIFAVPLVSFALIAALIGVIALPFGLGYVPLVFSYSIMAIISYIAKVVASMPMSVINIPTPPMIVLLAFYALLVFTATYYYSRRKAGIITGSLLIGIVMLVNFNNFDHTPQITMLDVGDGLCLHIKTENNKHIIVDGGKSIKEDSSVVKYLRSIDARDLILICTHDDLDHYGGFVPIANEFKVESYLSPVLAGDDQYDDLIKTLQNKKVNVVQFMAGSTMEFDGVSVNAIAPGFLKEDSNYNSLQAYVTIKNKKLLITGDTPIEQESNYDRIDILQVAHHGSKTSTSPKMLTQTQPEVSLVSGDKYMDNEVLNRLGYYYDTKTCGAVRLYLEDNIKIKTMKGKK